LTRAFIRKNTTNAPRVITLTAAPMKKLIDFEEAVVLYRAIASGKDHQPRMIPGLHRGLGDKFGRKMIIEIAGLHKLPDET